MGGRFSGFTGGVKEPTEDFPPYKDEDLITREKWGAKPPAYEGKPLKHPADKVRYGFTHQDMCYSVKECSQRVRDLQQDHFDVGMPDICHNFLVGGDGNIYEGIGWHKRSDIADSQYELMGRTIDIALIGPFREMRIPDNMVHAAETVTNYGVKHNYITYPHDADQYHDDDVEFEI